MIPARHNSLSTFPPRLPAPRATAAAVVQLLICAGVCVGGLAYPAARTDQTILLVSFFLTGGFVWALISWRRVAGTLFKVEVFRLSEDAHDQERFRRRQAVMVDGRQVFFPTAEDVRVLVRSALTNAPEGQWRRYLGVVLDGLRA